jgi:hypothetical protein
VGGYAPLVASRNTLHDDYTTADPSVGFAEAVEIVLRQHLVGSVALELFVGYIKECLVDTLSSPRTGDPRRHTWARPEKAKPAWR